MRFHEAYELMENGKGIRRHHWKPSQCLRMKRGVIYVCTDQWHKRLKSIDAKCLTSADWTTTDINPIKKKTREDVLDYFKQLNQTL